MTGEACRSKQAELT